MTVALQFFTVKVDDDADLNKSNVLTQNSIYGGLYNDFWYRVAGQRVGMHDDTIK